MELHPMQAQCMQKAFHTVHAYQYTESHWVVKHESKKALNNLKITNAILLYPPDTLDFKISEKMTADSWPWANDKAHNLK